MWRQEVSILLVFLVTANAIQLHHYIINCCDDGANYANTNGTCKGVDMIQKIEVILQDDVDVHDCRVTMRSCCQKELQRKLCLDGLGQRSHVGSCDKIKEENCSSSTEKTCCECCELGLRAYKENAPCEGLDLGIECDYAFRQCCHSASQAGDRDECSIANDNGHTLCTGRCVNLIGSYTCECPIGFTLASSDNMTCVRAEENTSSMACLYANCEYGCRTVGSTSHECYCDQGFDLDTDGTSCIDIDECMEDNVCPPHKRCLNYIGSFYCQATRCVEGQYMNKVTGECSDLDECAAGLHDCGEGFRCDNSPGSYRCVRTSSCGTGYTIDADFQTCQDIDECRLNTDNCPPEYYCQNTVGSYKCKRCRQGFKADTNDGCTVDINECEEQTANCPFGEECTNNYGSYTCSPGCPRGMQFDAIFRECRDINECNQGTDDCSPNQICQNTDGSYECTCQRGWEFNQRTRECDDMNECERGTHNCRINEQCFNFEGSFTCQQRCQLNYRYNASVGCVDINECEQAQYPCRGNSQCVNLPGSFRCQQCPRGQIANLDARQCEDVDECKYQGPNCMGGCKNTFGSYMCTCPSGYELVNRYNCRDIDECLRNIHNCSSQSACFDTRGGFKCKYIQCPQYYNKEINGGEVRCVKVNMCPNNDLNCVNERVKLITYNKIALPSLRRELREPLELLKLQIGDLSFAQKEGLHFELTQGNELGLFNVVKSDSRDYRWGGTPRYIAIGTLHLMRSMIGPYDTDLRLEMKLYNLNGRLISVTAAIFSINIGVNPF